MTTGGGFIAGSIIGKMVLDMTGWKQSIATVDKDGKALGSKFDALGQKFQDVGTKMTVVGAAVVASLSAMIIKSAKYGDEMVEVSQKVGINVTVLSSYKLAADKTGMSIDGLARGLKFLAMNMVEASKGTGDGAAIFKELGISVTDASGKLRDTDVVLGEVATAFSGMEGGAEKTTLAVKLFGRAGMDMIPFLNFGADGLARERTEAERLGLVLSGPAAKAQNEFNDQLDALKDATLGASMAIGSALIPAANAIVKIMIDAAAGVVAWTKEHPGLTKAIGTVVLAIGALLSLLGPLTIAIGVVLKNIVYLRAAASKAIVFTVVLAGAAVLIKAMSDFKYEFDNMNAAMKQAGSSGFERFLESINSGWRRVALGIKDSNIVMSEANVKTINLKGAMILLGDAFRAIKGAIEQGATIPVINLTALFKEFGLKTRTELTAELAKAEEALRLLKGSAEATPGAIKALEDKIVSLKEGITGVTVETRSLAEQLGITFRADAEARIKKLNEALLLYRGQMTDKKIAEIRKEIESLSNSMKLSLIPAADAVSQHMDTTLSKLEEMALGAMREIAKVGDYTADDMAADLDKIAAGFQKIPKAAKIATTQTHDYFAGMLNDIARGFGDAIAEWCKGLTTFKDFAAGIWGNIKDAFFRMIGQMIAEWTVKFITQALIELGILKAAVVTATGEMAAAATTSFGAMAVAAASFLSVIGAIAVAIIALLGLFGLLGDSFPYIPGAPTIGNGYEAPGRGEGPHAPEDRGRQGPGDRDRERGGYATGGIAWTPQLARIAEREPEIIMPLRQYRGAQNPAGGGKYPQGGGPNGPVNLTFYIKALDGADMINVVHNKIKPILQNILNHNGLRVPTGAVGGA